MTNKNILRNSKSAFSLVELLVVIAVLATVIGLALPNFLGARSRARDARRKGELNQMKTALQLYYNDYKAYPAGSPPTNTAILGCGADGDLSCPRSSCSIDFGAGGSTDCDTANMSVYMTQFPGEYGTSIFYYQVNSGADFCLKTTLENVSDSDIALSQSRCSSKCSALSGADYAVCSE